jgi:hypothetical protein
MMMFSLALYLLEKRASALALSVEQGPGHCRAGQENQGLGRFVSDEWSGAVTVSVQHG